MRILIVNVHFSPEAFGGATIVAEQTAARLRADGHDVFVLTTTPAAGRRENEMSRWDVAGVPVVGVAVATSVEHTVGFSNPDFVARFRSVLDVIQPDLVHFHSIQFMGVEQVEEAQSRGFPTVVTLHDAWWLCERQFMIRPSHQWCGQTAIDPRVCSTCVVNPREHVARQERSKRILNRCARVLVPSPYWRELMIGSGLDESRVFVNGNGVVHPPPGWSKPPALGPLRFGYVGGLHAVKGYHEVVRAFQLISRSDYELQIVDSLLNLGRSGITLEDFPLPGYVKIIPGYTQETLDDFFGGIDVLLFPSQGSESYGLTVREALARGVWPIATEIGAVADAIQDGVDGSLISLGGSGQPLAGALHWVLDHVREVRAVTPSDRITTFDEQVRDLERHFSAVVNPSR